MNKATNVVHLPQKKAHKDEGTAHMIFLPVDKLFPHPKNLRKWFPEEQVRETAASIRSGGGVLHALLVTPKQDDPGNYYVVDGNMRLAGGKYLGKDCPKLKCEVISATEAEQKLAMIITCTVRYTPDPVSQALHYQNLIDEEGYTVQKIADATGIHRVTIENRLKLIKLDEEIQKLIAEDKLPVDARAVDALLSIDNKKARIKLAQRLAADQSSIKAIVNSCQRLIDRLEEQRREEYEGAPAIHLANKANGAKMQPATKVKWQNMRKAAQETCSHCEIRLTALKGHPEPAWSAITHIAGETCGSCSVREIRQACAQCPAVSILCQIAKHAS